MRDSSFIPRTGREFTFSHVASHLQACGISKPQLKSHGGEKHRKAACSISNKSYSCQGAWELEILRRPPGHKGLCLLLRNNQPLPPGCCHACHRPPRDSKTRLNWAHAGARMENSKQGSRTNQGCHRCHSPLIATKDWNPYIIQQSSPRIQAHYPHWRWCHLPS